MNRNLNHKCRSASVVAARALLALLLAVAPGNLDSADAKSPGKERLYIFVEGTATNAGDVATFGVRLSNASNRPVTVYYSTFDWTAYVDEGDYLPAWGTLTFAPGETYKTVTVQTLPDLYPEYDEAFYVWAALVKSTGSFESYDGSSSSGFCTIFGELGSSWWLPPQEWCDCYW